MQWVTYQYTIVNTISHLHRGCIIQDLGYLRQLDDIEVTQQERQEAGYSISSSSDEENEDDEEGDDERVSGKADPEGK